MWVWLKHVILLLVAGFGLSLASDFGSAFFAGNIDGTVFDLFSGDSDDLGSGYESSPFVLPSVINNSSKEDAIDEYIIVDEDGDDHRDDGDLYVEVEAHSVDGSGSGDHDEFIQNEMLYAVDVDDVGSGEAVHEEAQGSGAEDKNDVGSIETLGGNVVNGYRIMGEYDYAYDYDYRYDSYNYNQDYEEDYEEDFEDFYVDVEAHSVDGSGSGDHDEFFQNEMLNAVDVDDVGSGEAVDEEAHGSGEAIHEEALGSGEAVHEEAHGSGAEDKNDVGFIEILGGDVVNGYRIMGVSSNQVAPDNSVEESLVENDEISLEVNVEAVDVTEAAFTSDFPLQITSEPPKMETSSPVTVEKSEDEEEEDEDIHEILDYLNLVETTTAPVEDIIDYLNSMEALAEPLEIAETLTTEEEVMERKGGEFEDDLDDWNKFSEHQAEMMVSGAGSKQAATLIVVISVVITPLFWI